MMAIAVVLAFTGKAAAQSGNSCYYTQEVAGYEFNNPAWVAAFFADGYSCTCIGSYLDECTLYSCTREICPIPPTDSPNETAPGPPPDSCPKCSGQASRPVNVATGNVFIQQTDLQIPGLGGGLNLTRTWNSMWPISQGLNYGIGIFGVNWTSTYEERVFMGNDSTMKYARSDGSVWSFWPGNPPVWQMAAPATAAATLTGGDQYWTIKFSTGEQRIFSQSRGVLTGIVDRNGNATTLSYDLLGRLVTVTDPAGRHLYFSYGTSDCCYVVTSVTSDVGLTASYTYNNDVGHFYVALSTVTEPDSQVFQFTYGEAQYLACSVDPPDTIMTLWSLFFPPMITEVQDAESKILEAHTYDSTGRALTSSRYDGSVAVDAITLAYQWAPPVAPPELPICRGNFPCGCEIVGPPGTRW